MPLRCRASLDVWPQLCSRTPVVQVILCDTMGASPMQLRADVEVFELSGPRTPCNIRYKTASTGQKPSLGMNDGLRRRDWRRRRELHCRLRRSSSDVARMSYAHYPLAYEALNRKCIRAIAVVLVGLGSDDLWVSDDMFLENSWNGKCITCHRPSGSVCKTNATRSGRLCCHGGSHTWRAVDRPMRKTCAWIFPFLVCTATLVPRARSRERGHYYIYVHHYNDISSAPARPSTDVGSRSPS